jgi:hypothetical protein
VAERIYLYRGSIPAQQTSSEALRGEYFYQIHHVDTYGDTDERATLVILDYGNSSSVVKQVKLIDFIFSRHVSLISFSRRANVD